MGNFKPFIHKWLFTWYKQEKEKHRTFTLYILHYIAKMFSWFIVSLYVIHSIWLLILPIRKIKYLMNILSTIILW